jgi:parallel beta-helix repeat protein
MHCESCSRSGKWKPSQHRFYLYVVPLALLLASLALSGCDLAVSIAVGPRTFTVCPSDCDYTSIQGAIEMAGSGDIIEVKAGVYHESLIINKSLTLLGEGSDQTTIYGAGGPTITILSGSVHIEGFTITGGKETEERRWDGDGISIEGSAAANIQNIVIKCNDNDGIEVKGYAKVTMQESDISHNGWGLFLRDNAEATVQGSSIRFNGSGIVMRDSAEVDISDSTVSSNLGNGISLWDSTEATVTNPIIFGNGSNGIRIRDRGSAIVEDNWISFNDGDGILLSDWAAADIRYNTITNNEGWGVAAYEWPCHPTDELFFGTVSGWGNEIPDWWEEDGNGKGDVCPESLRWEL